MKKYINNRFLLFIVSIFICGLLTGYYILTQQFLSAVITTLVFIGISVLLFINYRKIAVIIMCVSCLIIGVATFFTQYFYLQSYNKNYSSVTLTGRISIENYTTSTNYAYALLDNISINTDGKTNKLNGKVIFGTYLTSLDLQSFVTGNIITVDCNLNGINLFADGVNSYLYRNNVYWEISSYGNNISFTRGRVTLSEKCITYIKQTLLVNMDYDTAGLAQGLILGDKSQISYSTGQAYRNLGIVHLFAVSGLHIGFIVLVISFILSKLKVKGIRAAIITMLPIILYAYICGFPPSIMRAGLMCLIGLVVNCLHKDIDVLSRMAFAMIIILVVSPLYIFDAAFLLSFASVFGIATITSAINSFVKRNTKLSKFSWLITPLALSFGATVATLPFVAYFYQQVSVIGVFINLFVIPVITVVFIMLLIGLIPYLNFLLIPANYILSTLNKLLLSIETNTISSIAINDIGFGVVFLIALLFIISGYINISKRSKLITSVVSLILCIAVAVITAIPIQTTYSLFYYNQQYAFTDNNGYLCVVTNLSDDKTVALINDISKKYKIVKIDLIVTDYTAVTIDGIISLSTSNIDINKIYVFNTTKNNTADVALSSMQYDVTHIMPNTSNNAEIEVSSVYDAWLLSAITVTLDNCTILITLTENLGPLTELSSIANTADIIITSSKVFDNLTEDCIIVTSDNLWNEPLNIRQLGNFCITVNKGKLVLNKYFS